MDRIIAALRDLRKSITRIKELSAWVDLKTLENPRQTYLGLMYDPTEFDIKVEVGFFLKLSMDLRQHLVGNHGPGFSQFRNTLTELEKEFRSLTVDIPICRQAVASHAVG